MANQYGFLTAGMACLALVAGAAGCSSSQPPAQAAVMVDPLPAPNFEGPDLAEPPPVAIAAKPLPPLPPPGYTGIPRDWSPAVRPVPWHWIVIHHSATPTGGAAAFDKMHRGKGWDELGYHFVVGNGTDTRDGQVEVGGRWPRQKWGAHAKTPDNRYNDFGIGVCLVGNFDNARPTDEQMKSLSKLVAHLMKTYQIPADRVVGHGDTGRPTECPGKLMNITQLRQLSVRILADGGDLVPSADTQTAAVELLNHATH
jgi:hypothetical protein